MTAPAHQAQHLAFRYADEFGFRASCWCRWSTTRRTREQRNQDADVHELEGVVQVRGAEVGGAG